MTQITVGWSIIVLVLTLLIVGDFTAYYSEHGWHSTFRLIVVTIVVVILFTFGLWLTER